MWAALILWLSVSAPPNLPDVNFFEPDKLAHMFVYGVLAFLILWGFSKSQTVSKKMLQWTAFGCSLYGFVLECVQYFLCTGRYFENLDNLANIIGAILGVLIFHFLNRTNSKK